MVRVSQAEGSIPYDVFAGRFQKATSSIPELAIIFLRTPNPSVQRIRIRETVAQWLSLRTKDQN
jgi:hypothetical protein